MIRMNRIAAAMVADMRLRGEPEPLKARLGEIASRGFVAIGGCYLLSVMSEGRTNATLNDFPDKTGYECFINYVLIEDYASRNFALQAAKFCASLFEQWRKQGLKDKLNALMSFDHDGAVVRLHLARPGEAWLSDDLDGYVEAVLELSSDDREFFDFLANR